MALVICFSRLCNHYRIVTQLIHFCAGWEVVMKGGSLTASSNKSCYGRSAVSCHNTVYKPVLTARKCVRWDWQWIIHYELFTHIQIIDSNLFCQQFDSLKKAVARKRIASFHRRGIMIHQDNARPNILLLTRQQLSGLCLEVPIQSSDSPNFVLSDNQLFLPQANAKLASTESCKIQLTQFLAILRKSNNSTFDKQSLQWNANIINHLLLDLLKNEFF